MRWRHGRPCLTYRIGKLVARHRAATALGVASLAAVVALGAFSRSAWAGAVGLPRIDAPGASKAAGPDKSIAVLPFVDLSEAHNQEYFSDGLSDELIDRLARTGDLRVIAARPRSSSGAQRRCAPDRARTRSGRACWRQRSQGRVDDPGDGPVDQGIGWIPPVVADLRSRPDRPLQGPGRHLQHGRQRAACGLERRCGSSPAPERNIEAYNAFLQGWYFYQRATQEDLNRSVAAYRDALVDPNYARAWAELARAYVRQGNWQWDTVENAYGKARDAIEHALAIDPTSRSRTGCSAMSTGLDLNRDAGQADSRRRRQLDPSDADALSR